MNDCPAFLIAVFRGFIRCCSIFGAAAALGVMPTQVAAENISILYKRNSEGSVSRTHTAAQATLQTLESELGSNDFDIVQPPQGIYDRIGDAPGLVVTFARDAGFAVLVDTQLQSRPYESTDRAIVSATVRARVTHGNRVIASLSQYAQVVYKPGASETRAHDIVAERASKALTTQIVERIRNYETRIAGGNVPDQDAQEPTLSQSAHAGAATQPALTSASIEPDAPIGRRWALLIGVADFKKVRALNNALAADLPAVRNDINRLHQTLLELGYRDDSVTVLVDAQATTAAVKAALDTLARQTKPEDQVFVFLGSHGAPKDGAWSDFGVPLLHDTKLGSADVLDFEKFKAALKRLPARRVIWANDTCHSGGALTTEPVVLISSRNFAIVPRTGFDEAIAASQAGKHLAVFASSRASQLSYNTASNDYGLFSSHFINALKAGESATTLDLYRRYLEAQIPAAARALPCKPSQESCPPVQQPGFAFAAGGDRLKMR